MRKGAQVREATESKEAQISHERLPRPLLSLRQPLEVTRTSLEAPTKQAKDQPEEQPSGPTRSFQPPGREQLQLEDASSLQVSGPSPSPRAHVTEKLSKRSLQLKAELQACEQEAAALRHRLIRLEDQSKAQRRIQWERQALQKDWGSGSQTWIAWKAFAEKSMQEALRLRRIIGKAAEAPDLAEPEERLAEVNAELQNAKSELEEDQAERVKLTRAVKLGEADARQRRCQHHFEAESLWAEIARMERDESRMRPEELAEQKSERKLRQEVQEERRSLESTHSRRNERLRQADEEVDLVCMKILQLERSAGGRQEKMEEEHKRKVEALRSECQEMHNEIAEARGAPLKSMKPLKPLASKGPPRVPPSTGGALPSGLPKAEAAHPSQAQIQQRRQPPETEEKEALRAPPLQSSPHIEGINKHEVRRDEAFRQKREDKQATADDNLRLGLAIPSPQSRDMSASPASAVAGESEELPDDLSSPNSAESWRSSRSQGPPSEIKSVCSG